MPTTAIVTKSFKINKIMICTVLALFILGSISALPDPQEPHVHTKWQKELFPNPEQDALSCRSTHLCDPDEVLDKTEIHIIEQHMAKLEALHLLACHHKSNNSNSNSKQVPIELGIAIVQMVCKTNFYREQKQNDAMRKKFFLS